MSKQRLAQSIGVAVISTAAVSILPGCNLLSQIVDSTAGTVCGDLHCDAGETEESCPQDCPDDNRIGCGQACSIDVHCDDGDPCTVDACTAGTGFCEGLTVCENPTLQCPEGQSCANGDCVSTATADVDGESVCGNGRCDPGETSTSCQEDCPDAPIGCGQGCSIDVHCDDGNSCTIDTCTHGTGFCAGLMVCTNTPMQCTAGQTCSNGICLNP